MLDVPVLAETFDLSPVTLPSRSLRAAGFISLPGLLHGPVQVPGRVGPVRRPDQPKLRQGARLGLCVEAVKDAIPLAHPEIVYRQDVGPPQGEDQQHLHSPTTDAAD